MLMIIFQFDSQFQGHPGIRAFCSKTTYAIVRATFLNGSWIMCKLGLQVVRRHCSSYRRLGFIGTDGRTRHFIVQTGQHWHGSTGTKFGNTVHPQCTVVSMFYVGCTLHLVVLYPVGWLWLTPSQQAVLARLSQCPSRAADTEGIGEGGRENLCKAAG